MPCGGALLGLQQRESWRSALETAMVTSPAASVCATTCGVQFLIEIRMSDGWLTFEQLGHIANMTIFQTTEQHARVHMVNVSLMHFCSYTR